MERIKNINKTELPESKDSQFLETVQRVHGLLIEVRVPTCLEPLHSQKFKIAKKERKKIK